MPHKTHAVSRVRVGAAKGEGEEEPDEAGEARDDDVHQARQALHSLPIPL